MNEDNTYRRLMRTQTFEQICIELRQTYKLNGRYDKRIRPFLEERYWTIEEFFDRLDNYKLEAEIMRIKTATALSCSSDTDFLRQHLAIDNLQCRLKKQPSNKT